MHGWICTPSYMYTHTYIRTREGDEVDIVKVVVVKLPLKYGEVVIGRWQVEGPVEVGRFAVQSSQKHAPAGSSGLHALTIN